MPDPIAALLRQAGIVAAAAEHRPLELGKTLIRLTDGAGFVKFGRHPSGRALLRSEADAYRSRPPDPPYRRPDLLGFQDGDGITLLWLSALDGRSMRPWSALQPRDGPYRHQAQGHRDLAELLPEPETAWIAAWSRRLVARWGSVPIATGPSHGDFVYWNLLQPRHGGECGLIDFEYFEPTAPAVTDALFWRLAPLCRQAVQRRAGGLLRSFIVRLAPAPELALTLLRHGARFEREERLPDIGQLYPAHTLQLRRAQIALYSRLLEGLLA